MATIRRIFSYDDVEDKEIHDFLEKIPERQKSKHIRMAIRLYIEHLNEEKNNIIKKDVTAKNSNYKKDDYVDLQSIMNLGK